MRGTSCQTGCCHAGTGSNEESPTQTITHNAAGYTNRNHCANSCTSAIQSPDRLFKSEYLTYDPSVWQVEFKVGAGSAMSGQDVYDLIHIQFGCILHDNLGHGVPETWTSTQYLQQLGTIEYQVEKWVDTTTGEAVLVVYHYPPGNWENYRRIELVIDGNPDACISAAETVLGLSEADIIGN
jgi:hypothetical protein